MKKIKKKKQTKKTFLVSQETFLTKQPSSHVEASVPRVMTSAWGEQMSVCAEAAWCWKPRQASFMKGFLISHAGRTGPHPRSNWRVSVQGTDCSLLERPPGGCSVEMGSKVWVWKQGRSWETVPTGGAGANEMAGGAEKGNSEDSTKAFKGGLEL